MDSLTHHWWNESSKASQSNTQTRQSQSQFILLVQIHLAVSLFSATLLQEKMRMSQMISNVWTHDLQDNSKNVTAAWRSNQLLFGVPAGSNNKNPPAAPTSFPGLACGFIKTIRKEQKEILRIWMKTETKQAQKRFKKSKRLYCFKQARKTNKYDNNNKNKM